MSVFNIAAKRCSFSKGSLGCISIFSYGAEVEKSTKQMYYTGEHVEIVPFGTIL